MKNVKAVIGRNLSRKMRDALLMLLGNPEGARSVPLPTVRALLARGYIDGWDQTTVGHKLTEEGRKVAQAIYDQERADAVRALEGERSVDERFADIVAGLSVPDLRLFRELVVITDHPEMWVQQRWTTVTEHVSHILPPSQRPNMCGTAACLAGNLVVSAGIVRWEKRGAEWAEVYDVARAKELGVGGVDKVFVDYAVAGADLIGRPVKLDEFGNPDEGGPGQLFDANNTLADLWRIAGVITGGRIVLPRELEAEVRRIDEDRAKWAMLPYHVRKG